MINQWLIYENSVNQNDILDFERETINRTFQSPLVENHCYKSPEDPITSVVKLDNNLGNDTNKIVENTTLKVIYNNIIPIYGNNNERIVSARDLHTYMEVKDKFATWISRRIKKYGFIENEDYVLISQNCETSVGGTVRKDYYFKMDTAKEIAMVENNEKGKIVRKYFINIEKEHRQQNDLLPTSGINALKIIVAELENHDTRLINIEQKLLSLAN